MVQWKYLAVVCGRGFALAGLCARRDSDGRWKRSSRVRCSALTKARPSKSWRGTRNGQRLRARERRVKGTSASAGVVRRGEPTGGISPGYRALGAVGGGRGCIWVRFARGRRSSQLEGGPGGPNEAGHSFPAARQNAVLGLVQIWLLRRRRWSWRFVASRPMLKNRPWCTMPSSPTLKPILFSPARRQSDPLPAALLSLSAAVVPSRCTHAP